MSKDNEVVIGKISNVNKLNSESNLAIQDQDRIKQEQSETKPKLKGLNGEACS